MKANELMIGDWVTVRRPSNRREKVRVKSVIGNGTIEAKTKDGLVVFGELVVEPIPLTGEILEKNGFTHSFGDSDYYDYEKWEKKVDDKTIRVIKDHNGWFCRVDDIKLTRSMGIAPAVHTMQHIIRIGGIEKEIIL